MQILEHENGGTALGDSLEKTTPGRRGSLCIGAGAAVVGQAQERAQRDGEPARVARLEREPRHGAVQLPLDLMSAVGLENPRFRLHDFPERPERHALAVLQATPAAPRDQLRLAIDDPEEFADQS
jgi:hypothetical protein